MRRNEAKRRLVDHLRVLSGPKEGRVISLGSFERAVIGRSSACEVTIKDLSVSRRHAELELSSSGRWRVRDMDSRNGISVDGRTGPGWLEIEPGSTVVIGDVRLRFEAGIDPDEPETDPLVIDLEQRVPPRDTGKRSSRSEDPPSLPDLEPPRLKVAPPAWREGVRATGVAPENEASPSPPSYLLGAAIGLGVAFALAATILLVGRYVSGPEQDPSPTPSVDATTDAAINALLSNGRDAAEREEWAEAEAAGREVLAMSPEHPAALELMSVWARERRALTEITAAEAAFEAGERTEAVLLAEGVHAASRYRSRADDLLDRSESGASASSQRPRTRETTEAATEPQARTVRRRPPARTPQPRAPSPPPTTSRGPDPIIIDAKRAFSEGRVSDARAVIEAAADAGVDGAADLSGRLGAFHRASQSGEAASARSDSMVALAHFVDAHALAREISPPNGGAPGAAISRQLAELHYLCARESLSREDRGAARAHLERALSYQPGHSQARALLEGL